MKQDRYKELLNGHFRMDDEGLLYLTDLNIIDIEFSFSYNKDHEKHIRNENSEMPSRVWVRINPYRADKFIKHWPVPNKAIILVNMKEPEYALSYELLHSKEDRTIKVKILDLPERGGELIRQEEKNGIINMY